MAFDTALFASKLARYRAQFQLEMDELARLTGLRIDRLTLLEAGRNSPTGDEVLILADVFKCDYRFFISSDRVAPFDETEELFRRHGDSLTPRDRWAIQEFLYLCECEAFLLAELQRPPSVPSFAYDARDTYYKRDGVRAAAALREHLHLSARQDITDVFALLRRLGLRVFRRSLENSDISGLFVHHPVAGLCLLVNYVDDVYRQRFTAAHEACHAFLDTGQSFVVSYERGPKWSRGDLVEIRANAFASHFLLPDDLIRSLPKVNWNTETVSDFANRLRVNALTLLFRLRDLAIIDDPALERLRTSAKVPMDAKLDPELAPELSPRQAERKRELLHRGLSSHYVGLCFDAYAAGHVSSGRVAEMMLCDDREAREIGLLFGRSIA